MEDGVNALFFNEGEVTVKISGISLVVFAGTELERIYENGNDCSPAAFPRPANQTEVPFVESAHGRNKTNGSSRGAFRPAPLRGGRSGIEHHRHLFVSRP